MFGRVDAEAFWPCAAVVIDDEPDREKSRRRTEGVSPLASPPAPSSIAPSTPSIAKRPSAASVSIKKRPAARPSTSSSSTSKKTRGTVAAVETPNFIKMKYVKTGAVGIRERGGRQVMQILPVKEHAHSDEHMKTVDSWADTCITKLQHGESIDDVKKWVVEQKKTLLDAVAAAPSDPGKALADGEEIS